MLTVQIDENEVKRICLEKIEEQLKAIENEKVFGIQKRFKKRQI